MTELWVLQYDLKGAVGVYYSFFLFPFLISLHQDSSKNQI